MNKNEQEILLFQEITELQVILEYIEKGDIQEAVNFANFCLNDRKNQLWKLRNEDIDKYLSSMPLSLKEQLIKRSKR